MLAVSCMIGHNDFNIYANNFRECCIAVLRYPAKCFGGGRFVYVVNDSTQ